MEPFKRGQTAVEYSMLLGILLVLLIPLFYYAITTASGRIITNQAEDTVHSLAVAADEVYALSPGTKKIVEVLIPGGVDAQATSITGTEIILSVHIFGERTDVVAITKGQVSGTFPTAKGRYQIPVEHMDDGTVQIGESP